MASSSDTGCGALLAVAAIAFFVGRASVDDSEPKVQPPTSSAQQFLSAPVTDELPTPTPQPIYSPPERLVEPSVYFPNCSEARAAGAAPVRDGDPGYASHLDRDHDSVGCE
jgi:Excalibur calcium-binding domain